MLFGREKEQKILNQAYESNESVFGAVYGRRRIGKTYLIRKTFEGKFTFMHSGYYNGTKKEELFAFCASLREYGMTDFPMPSNWLEAFELLKDLIRKSDQKRKIIFLDELSWMDTKNSDLMMALEGFWNGWASARNDIVLIVCSSVTSWMLSNVIHNKGGLYNRLAFRINLKPFDLNQCEGFAKVNGIIMSRYQILECYMIMGGVPYYWSLLEKGKSLPQNIDRIFFEEDAKLESEFQYLYAALFKKPDVYIRIVTALGKKKSGMTRKELLEATRSSDTGSFTLKLKELESCGFIREYKEFGKKERNSLYQLIDNFTLFHFKFLADGPTDRHFWTNQVNQPGINAWRGLAFERVCLEHTDQIKAALGISGVLTAVNSWKCDKDPDKGLHGSQIDLLIVRKDQVINLCEMKYAARTYAVTEQTDEEIRNKIEDFYTFTKTKYAVFPTIITPYGLTENEYAGNIQSVVTAEDLFRF